MSQRKQKNRDSTVDDDARSMSSQRSSLSSLSQRSRSSMKKGMKSFGKGIKKVFKSGSPKKRSSRRKKKGEGDDDAESCGSAASYGSSHSLPLSSSPRSPRWNEEWTAPPESTRGSTGPVDVDTVDDNTNTTYDNNSNNSMGGQQRPSQSRPSRISLPKVVEGDNEDYDSTSDLGSIKNSSSHHKKKRSPLNVFSNKKNKNRNSGGGSVSSRGSKHTNRFSPSPIAPIPARKADELSLVILLVDPTSLRFELLSLDFDLATHPTTPNQEQEEQKKNNKKNKSPRKSNKNNENKNETTSSSSASSVSFTVQDVLDQITPESLTEETIKHNLLFKTTPIGLIDRTDQIHLGSASLDAVCSSRPLRNIMDCDFQKRLQMADPTSTPGPISLSLCELTYSGTPHRDVLLAYFGTKGDTAAEEDRVRATIALSRPIFTDPNVASLMENNGYDVSGWNGKKVNSISSAAAFAAADTSVHESSPLASSSTTTDGTTPTSASISSRSAATSTTTTTPITTLLGKPLPAKKRPKASFCTRLVHLLLVLLTVLVASLMAWSIVSGSFYILPSVFGRTRNSNSSHPLVTTSTSTSTSTPSRNTSTSTSTSTRTATITTSATDKEKGSNYYQNLPHTMEGYLRLGYASISSWMGQTLSQQERKEDTDTTTSEDDDVVNNEQEEEEVEKEDATIVIDDDDKENDRRDRRDDNDEIIDLDL